LAGAGSRDERMRGWLAGGRRGTVARLLARTFAGEEVRAVEGRGRQDRRLTTGKLLPEVLALKGGGLSQREVAERPGLTGRQGEHALRRWRERAAGRVVNPPRPSAALQCSGRCDRSAQEVVPARMARALAREVAVPVAYLLLRVRPELVESNPHHQESFPGRVGIHHRPPARIVRRSPGQGAENGCVSLASSASEQMGGEVGWLRGVHQTRAEGAWALRAIPKVVFAGSAWEEDARI
jgi:hypothetical protein